MSAKGGSEQPVAAAQASGTAAVTKQEPAQNQAASYALLGVALLAIVMLVFRIVSRGGGDEL